MASLSDQAICPAHADCKAPIDIILRASDTKEFGAHKAYLGTYSGGFPDADMVLLESLPNSQLETVDLPEKGDVLLLLLQFMHPERPPSLVPLDPKFMIEFAEVVEKYIVYGAIEACRLRLHCGDMYPVHTLDVFRHAIRHGDSHLRNRCAPLLLERNVVYNSEIMPGLSIERDNTMNAMRNKLAGETQYFPAFVAWARYKEAHRNYKAALNSKNGSPAHWHVKVPPPADFESFFKEELKFL